MKPRPTDKNLPIHTRRTVAADGLRSVEDTAYCDHKHGSMPVDDCIACAHCTYVSFSTREGPYLVCTRPGPAPAAVEGTVAEIMAKSVQCIRPDATIEVLVGLLVETGIGGAPVIDDTGRPVGVVSKTDVVRSLHERRNPATTTVDEIMTPVAFVLREDAVIERAAALMAFEGVHRIPVVAPDGVIVGIVTPLDITRAMARRAGL